MSGGYLDYLYSNLANALNIYPGHYGIGKHSDYDRKRTFAITQNPMHDPEISELMYDVSCLLHSLEWFESGDTGGERYAEDVRAFKEKWFGRTMTDSYSTYREKLTNILRDWEKYI